MKLLLSECPEPNTYESPYTTMKQIPETVSALPCSSELEDKPVINSLKTVHDHYRNRHTDSENRTLWQYLDKLKLDAEAITRELNLGVSDRTLTHELVAEPSYRGNVNGKSSSNSASLNRQAMKPF